MSAGVKDLVMEGLLLFLLIWMLLLSLLKRVYFHAMFPIRFGGRNM